MVCNRCLCCDFCFYESCFWTCVAAATAAAADFFGLEMVACALLLCVAASVSVLVWQQISNILNVQNLFFVKRYYLKKA